MENTSDSKEKTGSKKSESKNADKVESQATERQKVTIKSMLEAGLHFGHQTHRWNPRFHPYVYGERNGIHIINLDLTFQLWEKARQALAEIVSRGGTVLFVGTKRQARDIIKEEANRCGAFFVTSRWLGGMLTNFQTIKNSIDRMRKMEDLLERAAAPDTKIKLSKKERLTMSRDLEKLEANLGGIREMKRAPDILIVVDVVKEDIAISEAWKLRTPVIGVVDTNASPEHITFPIPANDDATRGLRLLVGALADTILESRAIFQKSHGR